MKLDYSPRVSLKVYTRIQGAALIDLQRYLVEGERLSVYRSEALVGVTIPGLDGFVSSTAGPELGSTLRLFDRISGVAPWVIGGSFS